jgi:subtilase family serine protease
VDLPAAAYNLIAVADDNGSIAEVNESNNSRLRTIQVRPDLIVSQLAATPSTAGAGSVITVTVATKNRGSSPAAATTTRLYLSADNLLDSSDALIAVIPVPLLAAGKTISSEVLVTVPAGTSMGAVLFLIALSDADGGVREIDEGNNSRSRSIKVQ